VLVCYVGHGAVGPIHHLVPTRRQTQSTQ
jgi:hypothetical protein